MTVATEDRVRELEDAIRIALVAIRAGMPAVAEGHLRRALDEEEQA